MNKSPLYYFKYKFIYTINNKRNKRSCQVWMNKIKRFFFIVVIFNTT